MKRTNIILLCLLAASLLFAQERTLPDLADETLTATKIDFSTFPEKITDATTKEDSTSEKGLNLKEEIVLFCQPSIFSTEIFYTLKSFHPVEIQLVDASKTVVYKTSSEGFVVNEKMEIPASLPAGEYFLTLKEHQEKQIKLLKK